MIRMRKSGENTKNGSSEEVKKVMKDQKDEKGTGTAVEASRVGRTS